MSKLRPLARLSAFAALAFTTFALAAPWQWRDADGRMVYSDQPPPPDVRASSIVHAPVQPARPAVATAPEAPAAQLAGAANAAAPAATGTGAAAPPRAPRTWAEKDMAFRQRMIERDEAGKKADEEQSLAARKARACDEARASLRALDSGMRLMTVNPRGEREPIDDAEHARRTSAAKQDIAQACGAG